MNKRLAMREEQERLAKLRGSYQRIITLANAENRNLNDAEGKDLISLQKKIEECETKIAEFESYFERAEEAKRRVSAGRDGRGLPAPTGPRVFESFGEQMRAVVFAGTPGHEADPRLFQLAPSGMSEGAPGDGGFLVQSDFSFELLNAGMEATSLAKRCARFPVAAGRNKLTMPTTNETSRATGSRLGGIRSYWANEAAEMTASRPKFRNIELTLNKLTALCYATDELLEDAVVLESFLKRAYPKEFAFVLDDAVLRGNGAGQPMGILNSGCLVTVLKESGQSADTILIENIVKMYARLPAASYDKAIWAIHQSVLPQLLTMTLTGGTASTPVFIPANTGISGKPYNTLLGLPVVILEQCSAIGDVGDIILGDFNEYLIADKALQSAASMHVRFIYNEMAFRWTYRVDGQPEPNVAVTPYKGSDTTSPFITLEAR